MKHRRFLQKIIISIQKVGNFHIVVVCALILYLFYITATLSMITPHLLRNSRETPLFTIPKRFSPASLSNFSGNAEKLEFQVVADVTEVVNDDNHRECSVTVTIILCEDAVPQNGSFTSTGTVAKDFSRQLNQTLVLLKSIAILTRYTENSGCVHFLLVSDKPSHYEVICEEIENQWSPEFQRFIRVTNIPVRYPAGSAWMRKLFRPCATLRLFLSEILPPKWDSVIYLDTDIIFLQSVQILWEEFKKFGFHGNGTKVAAMAPCLFHYGSKANSVPFFGDTGLNAGVMLMNLTRMRNSQWTNKVRMVTTMFQEKIKLADQDILNIYFHFFPEELHVLSCDWNFRPFQCRQGSYCEDEQINEGISALHGNALSFTPQGPEPLFRAVYRTFEKNVKLDEKFSLRKLVEKLEIALVKAEEKTRLVKSPCKQFGGFDVLLLNRFYKLLDVADN